MAEREITKEIRRQRDWHNERGRERIKERERLDKEGEN